MARKSTSPIPQYQPLKLKLNELIATTAFKPGDHEWAQTVLYVHGIANKPPEAVLRCQWDHALFRQHMGDKTRMAYWVIRERHGAPLDSTCGDNDVVNIPMGDAQLGFGAAGVGEEDDAEFIAALAKNPREAAWLKKLNDEMHTAQIKSVSELQGPGAKGIGDSIGRAITRAALGRLRKTAMGDVYDYFFDEERRRYMEQSLLDIIETGGAPFVVIGHSQGSMIAYNVLRQLAAKKCPVPLFVTIGSPLGIPMVRAVFEGWTGKSKLPFPPCVGQWVNVANKGDFVALDEDLSNDIAGGNKSKFENYVIDSADSGFGSNRHGSSGYLKTSEVRNAVVEIVGPSFAQPVSDQVIARDLVGKYEDSDRGFRHPVLIEFKESAVPASLDALHAQVTQALDRIRGSEPVESLKICRLKRYVSAELTRAEIERLRTERAALKVQRVWQDAVKVALINESRKVVQVKPANASYGALGDGITWAVLDTGIRDDHPHFNNAPGGAPAVLEQWDCTGNQDQPVLMKPGQADSDRHGHGTHVSGIIAGFYPGKLDSGTPNEAADFAGLAPNARIIGYKVLNNSGRGQDSYIIKALDHIASVNENAGQLVIHGVNLSLGGPFDPSVYGCGHTPICNELRRLWRQGVVVVIAAGNEGYATLQTADGDVRHSNMDLSIGDPGNLEESICVGSVHRSKPHLYGVSYFSSRGPTADGRLKPDVVAPGEKILSAWGGYTKKTGASPKYVLNDIYVEMSGTSMAAPHVSGLVAAFLSVRREFIGYPDRVKQMLLASCTDIGRDRYLQGHGVPNLIKMLVLN
jgi:subtilisin family serine protease